MRHLSGGLLVVASVALVAALPAAAKNGVKATLETSIPLAAKPGTKLGIAWRLAFLDEHGRRQPFGAGGVFVRLLSASGAGAETGVADETGTGEYTAKVVVPKGGIGDVQIGIHSWVSGPSGTRSSDWLVPITNDPMPGTARITGTPSGGQAASGSTLWIVVVAGSALFALCVIAAVITRRKRILPA